MRKKALALGLSLLFFGSIATSTFGMQVANQNQIVVVDGDDDKKKADKKSKSEAKTETKKSSECCSSQKSSCDGKKSEAKK